MTTTHKLIEQVINSFKFEKVLITMQALDWKWRDSNTKEMHVPTIARMKAMATNLLFSSIEDTCCGSGGFEARYTPTTEHEPESFELKFIVTETNTDPNA